MIQQLAPLPCQPYPLMDQLCRSLVSGDLENLSSSSQAIGKLQMASSYLRVLPSGKTTADKNSVLQKVVEEAVPTASVDAPKSTLPAEPLADKRYC